MHGQTKIDLPRLAQPRDNVYAGMTVAHVQLQTTAVDEAARLAQSLPDFGELAGDDETESGDRAEVCLVRDYG